jgi:hypothetical protein
MLKGEVCIDPKRIFGYTTDLFVEGKVHGAAEDIEVLGLGEGIC